MRAEALLWPLLAASLGALGCGRTRLDEPAGSATGLGTEPRCETLALAGPPQAVTADVQGLHGPQLLALSDDGTRVALLALEPEVLEEPTKFEHTLLAGRIEPFGAWPAAAEVVPLPLDTQVRSFQVARQLQEHMVLAFERQDLATTWVAYDMPDELSEMGPTAYIDDEMPHFISRTAGRYLFGFGYKQQRLRVMRESSSDWAFEPARWGVCSSHRLRMDAAPTGQGWLVAATEWRSDHCAESPPYDRLVLQAVDLLGDWQLLWDWPLYSTVDTLRVVPAEGGAWLLMAKGGSELIAVRVTWAGEVRIGPLKISDDVPWRFRAVPWYDGVALAWSDSQGLSVATFDATGQRVEQRTLPLPEGTSSVNEPPALLASADQRSLLVGYALTEDEPAVTTWLARFDCR